jgi:hypothetical protein
VLEAEGSAEQAQLLLARVSLDLAGLDRKSSTVDVPRDQVGSALRSGKLHLFLAQPQHSVLVQSESGHLYVLDALSLRVTTALTSHVTQNGERVEPRLYTVPDQYSAATRDRESRCLPASVREARGVEERLLGRAQEGRRCPERGDRGARKQRRLDHLLIRHPAHAACRNPDSQGSSSPWLVHRLAGLRYERLLGRAQEGRRCPERGDRGARKQRRLDL